MDEDEDLLRKKLGEAQERYHQAIKDWHHSIAVSNRLKADVDRQLSIMQSLRTRLGTQILKVVN